MTTHPSRPIVRLLLSSTLLLSLGLNLASCRMDQESEEPEANSRADSQVSSVATASKDEAAGNVKPAPGSPATRQALSKKNKVAREQMAHSQEESEHLLNTPATERKVNGSDKENLPETPHNTES